jgi:hypothetical protein
MSLLVAFALIMVFGLAADVLIAVQIEKHYQPAGIPVFFLLGAALVVGGWRLAIRATARWAKPAAAEQKPTGTT